MLKTLHRMIEAQEDTAVFAWCLSCNRPMLEASTAERHEDVGHAVEWDLHADDEVAA